MRIVIISRQYRPLAGFHLERKAHSQRSISGASAQATVVNSLEI
jgi:hypothetical protein